MSLLNELTKTMWLTDSDTLSKVYDVVSNHNNMVDMLERYNAKPVDEAYLTSRRGDTAIVNIKGIIMRYGNFITKACGTASLDVIATEFQQALDDSSVKSIILNIDSAGGSAAGINEFAEHIYNSRGKKPIKAYVGGTCASAAYFIASACDEIIVDEMAVVGSIGTVVVVGKRNKDSIEIVSSQSPNKRIDAETDEGALKIKAMLDDMTAVFLDKVARNRAISINDVVNAGDAGGVVVGHKAVDGGLVDKLGSFEGLINELNMATKNVVIGGFMNENVTEVTATADEQVATALNAERERVSAILDMYAVGAESIVFDAVKTGASVAETAVKVVAVLKEARPVQEMQPVEQPSLYVAPLAEETSEEDEIEQKAEALSQYM